MIKKASNVEDIYSILEYCKANRVEVVHRSSGLVNACSFMEHYNDPLKAVILVDFGTTREFKIRNLKRILEFREIGGHYYE